MKTTVVDGRVTTVITYQRDAAGRVISRSEKIGVAAAVTQFFYGSGGLVATKTGSKVTYPLSLPGGVQLAFSTATDQVWSYPNLHGDVIVSADKDGVRTGTRTRFDPFGQPIAADGTIGTTTVDDTVAAPESGVLINVLLYKGESANRGIFDLTVGPMSSTLWRHNDDSETADVCA